MSRENKNIQLTNCTASVLILMKKLYASNHLLATVIFKFGI